METNTATRAQGIAATNAQARVGLVEAAQITASFTPIVLTPAASNQLSLANTWLQQLTLNQASTLGAPLSPVAGSVNRVRLGLYVGAQSLTLGTNSLLIETNNAIFLLSITLMDFLRSTSDGDAYDQTLRS